MLESLLEFFDENSSHLKLLLIYVLINGGMLFLIDWIRKKFFLPEVGKEQILLYNIQSYRQLGVRVSQLRQEAFRIITKSHIAVNKMRSEGRSYMQMWEKLDEEFKPDNLLNHISSLKNDFSYLPANMIETIKELEDLYWEVFAELDFQKFKESERFIELTDKLLTQIRENTTDIMTRKKDISDLLSTMPKGGFASNSEINAAKNLAENLKQKERERITNDD